MVINSTQDLINIHAIAYCSYHHTNLYTLSLRFLQLQYGMKEFTPLVATSMKYK